MFNIELLHKNRWGRILYNYLYYLITICNNTSVTLISLIPNIVLNVIMHFIHWYSDREWAIWLKKHPCITVLYPIGSIVEGRDYDYYIYNNWGEYSWSYGLRMTGKESKDTLWVSKSGKVRVE